LHYRLVHFCFSLNKSIEKWAAFAQFSMLNKTELHD